MLVPYEIHHTMNDMNNSRLQENSNFFSVFLKIIATIFDGGASLPDDDLNKYGIHHFTFNSKCCVCVFFVGIHNASFHVISWFQEDRE